MNAARRTIVCLGALGFAMCGCTDSDFKYQHAKVHGKVTYKGKPVPFGSVVFIPTETPKDGPLQPASGSISPDGTYELESQSTSGAILGEHKVVVIAIQGAKQTQHPESSKIADAPPAPAKGSKDVQFNSVIPKKYSDPSTTTLTRRVEPGENTIDIEL